MIWKTIRLKDGEVCGSLCTDSKGKKYYSFTRIPYAYCPVGVMRFTESNLNVGWCGVLDCSAPVDRLSQPLEADLLFVNVFTPETPKYGVPSNSQKPVMVFVPSAGNYVSDDNLSTALYGPDYLVAEDVILVVVSYRSGILGFLTAPDMKIGGDMGMLDLLAALIWVKKNISAFNGDPKNVTLFAQGTGATIIQHTLNYFDCRDLYHKLILQHGSTDLNVVGYFDIISSAKALGLRDVTNDKQALKFLRALRFEKIVAYEKNFSARGVDCFSTMEWEMYDNLAVPAIIGHNANVHSIHMDDEEMRMFLMYRQQVRLTTLNCYYSATSGPFFELISQIGAIGLWPNLELEAAMCLCFKSTDEEKPRNPVYLYRFNVVGDLNFVKKSKKIAEPGAIYGDELGYIFKVPGAPKPKPGSVEDNTIKKMTKYWTNFAKTGDPNSHGETTWQPVTKDLVSFTAIEENTCNKVLYEANNNHQSSNSI